MNLLDAVRERKSIRGFKKIPVSQHIISEILQKSLRAPSSRNIQPWELTVVTGEVLDRIREENVQKLSERNGSTSDFEYDEVYRKRQVELTKQIFALMDIKREDKEKRAEWLKRGFRFFDAPTAIIISMDKSLKGSGAIFDLGCLAQTICLVSMEYELGTCIEGQGVAFEEVIRKHTGLPDSKEAVTGIAIGYPDWDFPANKLVSAREDVNDITNWIGF